MLWLSDTVIVAIIAAVVAISTEVVKALKEYKIRKLDANRIELTNRLKNI